MKRYLSYLFVGVMVSTLLGCGLASKELKIKSQSERTDVFKEIKGDGPPSKGFVDLIIKASIKTHPEGYYLLESAGTFHGQPDYPFLITIDGQAQVWKVDGQKEITSYEDQGKPDPERGEGMKYVLNKRLRLGSGPHQIIFGLPGEDYYMNFNLTLDDGDVQVLEFKPIYRPRRGKSTPSFINGFDRGEIFLNGNIIR